MASPSRSPGEWRQLNTLLDVGLSLPPDQRDPWLAQLPPEHQPLREALRALLQRADTGSDAFLAEPAQAGSELLAHTADQPGDRVGPYRLLSELGHGGMATVWLATRDGDDLRRQVALKLPLPGWGPGLAPRMARERNILASLEHPNIARLYEAGLDAHGRPWLAMERVEGQPIDAYCREQDLSVPQRLQLLLQVATAVAHAHARLVVHRDLKPANILVTAQGDVRLLDFGIAKLLEDEPDAAQRDLTRQVGQAVTPDYAAPEQLAGGTLTVATDVYSLGVVMYELLAGQPPYRLPLQGLGDAARALARVQVPLASSRAGGDRTLARALRGDLDTIVAKAMKPEPAARYASVEALAADIQRHIDGLPVLARPDGLGYRSAKFLRRRRGSVVAATLVLGVVLAGSVSTAWQARRAEAAAAAAAHERDIARRELRFANSSEGFLRYLLGEGSDRPLTTLDLLQRADERVERQFSADPALRARLQMTLGELYRELDRFDDSANTLRKALAAAQLDGQPALLAAAECQLGGTLLALQGQAEGEAQALITRGLARIRAEGRPDDAWITCLAERALLHFRQGRLADMQADAETVLAQLGHAQPWRWPQLFNARSILALGLSDQGQMAEAVQLLRSTVADAERLGLERTSSAMAIMGNLPVLLWRAGQLTEARSAYERAISASTSAGRGADLVQLYNHARLLIDIGRADEALQRLLPLVATLRAGRSPESLAFVTLTEATARCELRDWPACDRLLAEALPLLQAVRPAGHSVFATVAFRQARSWHQRGDLPRAEAGLQAAVAAYDAAPDRNHGIVQALVQLARLQLQRGQPAAAQHTAERALREAQRLARGFEHSEFLGSARLLQALLLHHQGDNDGARRAAQNALQHLQASTGATAPGTREAQALLARLPPS